MPFLGLALLILGFVFLNWAKRQNAKNIFEKSILFHNPITALVLFITPRLMILAGIVANTARTPWLTKGMIGLYLIMWLFSGKMVTERKASYIVKTLLENRRKLGLFDRQRVAKVSINEYGDHYHWTAFQKESVFRHFQDGLSVEAYQDIEALAILILYQEYYAQKVNKGGATSPDCLINDETYQYLYTIERDVKKTMPREYRKIEASV
ncbi:MAG: hypothetical protein EOO61_08295 [Hymenobacter sp.]|nr:MAG: hypothetical protein EOO61_08295 [Hymenobacter sp.]